MLIFNDCRIDQETKSLIVEVSVDTLDYYDNVKIEGILIDNQETFKDSSPSSEAKHISLDTPSKTARFVISEQDLGYSLSKDMLFVYARATGTPTADTPCSCDKQDTLMVVVDWQPIYNIALSYLKEFSSNCSIPRGFIDSILKLKAFQLAIKTGNYPVAIQYWDKFFKYKTNVSQNKGCGCGNNW